MAIGWKQKVTLGLGAVAIGAVILVPPWRTGPRPFGVVVPFLPGVSYAPLWVVPVASDAPAPALAWDLLIEELLLVAVLTGAILAGVEAGRPAARRPENSTKE